MSAPKRLLDGAGDELELALLRSAKADVPSRESRHKTLAAMGIGTGVAAATAKATAAGSSAAATKLGALSLIKWVGIGVLGGAVTIGVVQSTSPSRPASPTFVAAPATQSPLPRPRTVVTPPLAEPTVESAASAPPTTLVAPMAPAGSPSAAASMTEPSLADEVAALDRARGALASGDPRGAQAQLDAYQQRFPRGVMGPEATVLRIEALTAAGDRAGARSMAEQFLATHPNSPHASRLRSLVGLPSIP